MDESHPKTVKRARIRQHSNSSSTASTSISHDILSDFCCSILKSPELERELKNLIHNKSHQASKEDSDGNLLPSVPLQFESSLHYLRVFDSLCLEEAKAIILSSLKETISRIGFNLHTVIVDEAVAEANSIIGEHPRYCRLRAAIQLPDRNSKKDWREAEAEQLGKRIHADRGVNPCGLSQLIRGDVLILLHGPMAKRDGGYFETQSTFVGIGIVSRTARPVFIRDSNGIEVEVAVSPETSLELKKGNVTAYQLTACNIVTTWREWDGLNALFSSRRTFTSPIIPILLSGGNHAQAHGRKLNEDIIHLDNVAVVDPNMPLSLPGATETYYVSNFSTLFPTQETSV